MVYLFKSKNGRNRYPHQILGNITLGEKPFLIDQAVQSGGVTKHRITVNGSFPVGADHHGQNRFPAPVPHGDAGGFPGGKILRQGKNPLRIELKGFWPIRNKLKRFGEKNPFPTFFSCLDAVDLQGFNGSRRKVQPGYSELQGIGSADAAADKKRKDEKSQQ